MNPALVCPQSNPSAANIVLRLERRGKQVFKGQCLPAAEETLTLAMVMPINQEFKATIEQ